MALQWKVEILFSITNLIILRAIFSKWFWHTKHLTSVNKCKAAWVKSCFFTSEPCAHPLRTAQQLSMFESPDAICFPSPIQPPPTTLQYNPTPRNILFVHPWPGTLSFFHSVICSQHRLTYISSPKQSFWVVVGAGMPLGDQSLLHTAAITLIWIQILLS